MKAILICLVATQLVLLQATEKCSNMWEADFNNPTVSICPVGTYQIDMSVRTGECQFPFVHSGQSYKHCILIDNFPSCKTSSGKWEKCIVETDAIVYGVTTRKAGSFSVNGASIKGGTMLWITGLRFAENSFSTSPSAETSNVVYLTNDFSSYTCDIHPDATTKTQITCFTEEMNPGTYLVQVYVKGKQIPSYQYTNRANAYIEVKSGSTPTISAVVPSMGTPGSFVEIKGSFKTSCFLRDTDGCADDSGARITRVYVGGQQCELIDPNTSELFKAVTSSSLYCRLDKPEIGYFRISMLVTNEFGRSEASKNMAYVSPDENIYHFQTYSEIDSISPKNGSLLGGTRVTITGKYLYTDENVPAMIEVGGKPCKVIDFNMMNLNESRIVCETSPNSGAASHYFGNRGVTSISQSGLTTFENLETAVPSNTATVKYISSAKDEASSGSTMWLKGYLYPRKNSSYEFTLVTNGVAKLFISSDESPANKQLVADSNNNDKKGEVSLQADTYYYFESVASSSSAGDKISLSVDGKMLNTVLTDKSSSSVFNELQEIEVTSDIVLEGYRVAFTPLPVVTNNSTADDNSTAEQVTPPLPAGTVQRISVKSNAGEVPFALSLFGVNTVMLEYGSSASIVQNALNDMPMLFPSLANVTDVSNDDDFKTYEIAFSANLGTVPSIEEKMGFVQVNVTRVSEPAGPGTMSYLMINDQPSALFNIHSDSAEDIKKAIDQSFGIRCPVSIQTSEDKDTLKVYDNEGCDPGVGMLNETAFCGKCAKKGKVLVDNSEGTLEYKYLCHAYKLSSKVSYVVMDIIDPLWKTTKSIWTRLDLINDNQWHYNCLDLAENYAASNPAQSYPLNTIVVKKVWVHPSPLDLLTDVGSLRKTKPQVTNMNILESRRMMPSLQYQHNTLTVTKSNTTLDFQFRPTNCSFNLAQFQIISSYTSAPPTLTRTSQASPPVTGQFNLQWDSNSLNNLAADITEEDMSALLQSMPNFGNTVVKRTQDCSGYKWSIKWLNGGNQPPLSINGNTLSGNNAAVRVNLITDGGALFSPLTSDILRTWHTNPQVSVSINEIPSKCSDCSFSFSNLATPTVTTINADTLSAIVITGTGFDPEPTGNLVLIGQVPCTVTAATTTQLTCSAGQNSIGTYSFTVNVLSKGFATMNSATTAQFQLTATAVAPGTGSTGGGNVLNITGTGFSGNTTVTIDGNPCKVISATYALIKCTIPSNPTETNKNVDIIVSEAGTDSTLPASYLYDFSSTPIVTTMSPSVLSVAGNEIVTFTGSNLPTFSSGVIISGIQVAIVSSNSTHLIVRSPSVEPGMYDLELVTDIGMARVNQKIEYRLFVTSFSPEVGSLRGGNLVNIYGGGFSEDCQKNEVAFDKQKCKVSNCSSEWIECETSDAYVAHVIDNQGADPYHGKGYAWSIPFLKATVGDSVTWKWQPPTGISTVSYRVMQVQDAASYATVGFDSGDATATGSFKYQFTQPGVYHYWSGYVESSKQIKFRGVIEVSSAANVNKELALNIHLSGKKAQTCQFPFTYKGVEYTQCTNTEESFNWCSPTAEFTGQKLKCPTPNPTAQCPGTALTANTCSGTTLKPFTMLFSNCNGNFPAITSLSRTNATFDDLIIISGSGFSTTQCENEVRIGAHVCALTASSATSLSCQIGPNSGLYANFEYPLEVLVKNSGYALQTETLTVKFLPKITAFTPMEGSIAGGLIINIEGDGFLNEATLVVIGNRPYYEGPNLKVNNFTSMHLETLPVTSPSTDTFKVLINNIEAQCPNCSFTHSDAATAQLNSVTPQSINSSNLVSISGRFSSSDVNLYTVTVGDINCNVEFVNFTDITCRVPGVSAGPQTVRVNVQGKGNAKSSQALEILGVLAVESIFPSVGSILGGTVVTITGNGFTKHTQASFGNYPCIVESATVNQLRCRTTDSTQTPVSTQAPITTQSTTQSTTPESTTSTQAANPCLTEYRNAMLESHNSYRALHNVSALTGSETIDNVAQLYAEHLAAKDLWEHSTGSGYGENLAKSWSSQVSSLSNCGAYGTKYAKMWYDEIAFYDFNNPGNKIAGSNEAIGHFTQVVWKGSTQVGCGIAISSTNFVYGVCNYSPPGNYIGQYGPNVPPLTNSRRKRSVSDILQSLQLNNFGNILTSQIVGFTYSASTSPSVTSVSPSSGQGGQITITGTNFGNQSQVTVGQTTCDVTTATRTEIICNLAPGPAGNRQIIVRDSIVGNSNSDIRYQFPLTVTALSNTEGSIGGGLNLQITGTGFSNETMVTICGVACPVTSAAIGKVTCKVPASQTPQQDSSCDVVVTENGLTAQSTFSYRLSLTPRLTSSSPSRGGTGGGTLVTINGSGFPGSANSVTVTIAGSPCLILSITEAIITCHTEPYKSSSVKAIIRVDIEGSGLALNDGSVQFEYIDLWSSKFTWGGMSPPGEGELAVIGPNQHIYFDAASTPILKGIIIQGGSLIFDDNQDVALNVEYVIINAGGKLQVGTRDAPFTHKATITMFGHVRSVELPIYGAKVLAVRNGTLDLHGMPVGVTWTHLGTTATSGSNTITLKEPVSWAVGSEIIIATTGDKFSPGESELAVITAKSGDSRTLTLNKQLKFEHLGTTRTVGTGATQKTFDVRAEVGLLTRNVKFQGHNDDTWNRLKTAKACPSGFNPAEFATQTCFLGRYGPELGSDEFGGIIFIAGGQSQPKDRETVIARLSNVELFHVGQAFKLGRYPIHFHLNGDMPSSYVEECAIHESFNRAINIHASNYLQLTRNVIYNIMGGAYFLEDGVEIGNRFLYNLAVFVRTSSSLLNEDVTPAAFWATNPNNTYLHNAVAGSTHFGWWYRILDHPEGPSYRPDYCPKKIPFGRHFNNSVHSTGRFGIWVFPGYMPTVTGACGDSNPSAATFEEFTSWGNDKGAEYVNSNNIQFKKFKIWDQHDTGVDVKIIKGNSAVNSKFIKTFYDEDIGPTISDSFIVGNSLGGNSIGVSGITLAWDRGQLIKNVDFYNYANDGASAFSVTSIDGTCSFKCGGWLNKVQGLTFTNVKYRHFQRWEWDNVLEDLDGSLTGKAGDVVVYNDTQTFANPKCQISQQNHFKNGIVCSGINTMIRFAFNEFNPEAANIVKVTDKRNMTENVDKLKKRLTHKFGFMMDIEANNEYLMVFSSAERVSNMSYESAFYGLAPGDWLVIKHNLLKKPDQLRIGGKLLKESETSLDAAVNANGDWYWDNSTWTASYLIKNVDTKPLLDVPCSFSAIKCRYTGCKPPESPGYRAPIAGRPENAVKWSDIATWGADTILTQTNRKRRSLPSDGDSIIIPDGVYVVVDVPLPKLKILDIRGYLELDKSRDHYLEANMIFINGGQLIAGWENDPILTNVSIVLTGTKDELDFRLPNGLTKIGGKGIGVFGGLDLHGKPRDVIWTQLEVGVSAGQSEITLKEAVDWVAGEEIVVTTTSFVIEQTETMTIAAVSQDKKTLTLTAPLGYDHMVMDERFDNGAGYKVAAAVGLLTRNVKVIGQEYPTQQADLYGFRIVVSDYSAVVFDYLAYYKGFARVSNTEFVHPGQFDRTSGDDAKIGILFSNLNEFNSTRPSYVRNSAFHHGLGTAISLINSHGTTIENNVIHRTIDYGIRCEGKENKIIGNLLTVNHWGATFLVEEQQLDKTYWASIDFSGADSAIVENNFVAGAERTGISYRGDVCDGQSLPGDLAHSVKNNIIHGAGAGVLIAPPYGFDLPCIKISGFSIYKSQYYGIYYQHKAEVVIDGNSFIDNQMSAFTIVLGPGPGSHIPGNKKTTHRNSLIVGHSKMHDCEKDVKPNNASDANSLFSTFGTRNKKSRIGIVFPTNIAASNGWPGKPWTGIMSYNTIGGLMVIKNVTFANFGEYCGDQSTVISSSVKNDDGQHPVTLSQISLFNVTNTSKVFIHRPNVGKINPSDCVDMDCDGLKKNLITDEDGTFLGKPGAVISQSEFEWGSQQRGLGDFRIPKEMLAFPNGSMIDPKDVYSHAGIVRDESLCNYVSEWQAYECHGMVYKMLIIESMDKDTEDRRLSPVAILSDNKYLDLINGPQDHGWCFGYTCQKRISTFMALIASNKSYDIVLTSTPPKQLRFRILNSDDTFKVKLSMHYTSPQRIDLYKDSKFVDPTNAEYVDGMMQIRPPVPSNIPTPESPSGTNIFLKQDQKIYFTQSGSSLIDLKIAPVLFVSFGLPAITPDEFFNEATIVGNFALLLGIDPSKIRRVEIVRASRRKRDVNAQNFIKIIIEENASPDSSNENAVNSQLAEMDKLDAQISNMFMTNQLQEKAASLLNVTLSSMAVQKPASAEEAKTIPKKLVLEVVTKATGCNAQIPCLVQPLIKVVDENGDIVKDMGNPTFPWVVVANMTSSSTASATLLNQTEMNIVDGYAQFTELGISEITEFGLSFSFKTPEGVNASKFDPQVQPPVVLKAEKPTLSCKQETSEISVEQNTNFNLEFLVVDKASKTKVSDIKKLANVTWSSQLTLHSLGYYKASGELTLANSTAEFDPSTGSAAFNNLAVTEPGMYLLTLTVGTSDNSYNFKCFSKTIEIIRSGTVLESYDSNLAPNYVFKYDGDFDSIEPEEAKANMYNYMSMYNITARNIQALKGSVYITFYSSSSSSNLISSLIAAGVSIDPNLSYSYASINDMVLNCTNCILTVATTTTESPIVGIAVGAVVGGVFGALVGVAIVLLALWGYKEFQKVKVKNTTISPNGTPEPTEKGAKAKAQEILKKMTGTTPSNYHTMERLPNIYDKSYMHDRSGTPEPTIPSEQRYE